MRVQKTFEKNGTLHAFCIALFYLQNLLNSCFSLRISGEKAPGFD